MSKCKYPFGRPNLLTDKYLGISIVAVVDTSGICGKTNNPPRTLLLQRGKNVANYPGAWAMPAGVIDNRTYRQIGLGMDSALLQATLELVEETSLLPEHIEKLSLIDEYSRENEEREQTFKVYLSLAETMYPEMVYTNWENQNEQWIDLSEVMNNENCLPRLVIPNLIPDIKRLTPSFQEIQVRFDTRH